MLTVGSLFSGIGGLELGLELTGGFRTIWHSEIEPFCCEVLERHWPGVPNLGDITQIDWNTVERPDVICGGFPCQDISVAGKGAGIAEGTRSGLWFEFARAIRILRPRIVLVENVAALVVRGLDIVLADLAALRYDAEWAIVPAAAVGAPHRRERLFIVGWLADSLDVGGERSGLHLRSARQEQAAAHIDGLGERELPASAVADAGCAERRADALTRCESDGTRTGREQEAGGPAECSEAVGNPAQQPEREPHDETHAVAGSGEARRIPGGAGGDVEHTDRQGLGWTESALCTGRDTPIGTGRIFQPIERSTFWDDAEYILCGDGKRRATKSDIRGMVDGFPRWLDEHPKLTEPIREAITHAYAEETRSAEALSALWDAVGAEALQRSAGGLPHLFAQEILLAFMQRAGSDGQGRIMSDAGSDPFGVPRASPASDRPAHGPMRVLRDAGRAAAGDQDGTIAASCERGLPGQPAREPSGLVQRLSQLMAHAASEAWSTYKHENARIEPLLATNIPRRVAKLKALGNAVVPEVARYVGQCILESL